MRKSAVRVGEKGTETSGATVGGVRTVSLPPKIILDWPFLFGFVDHTHDSLLFLCSIGDPDSASLPGRFARLGVCERGTCRSSDGSLG